MAIKIIRVTYTEWLSLTCKIIVSLQLVWEVLWCSGKCVELWHPVALLCSLLGKYPWETHEPPYSPCKVVPLLSFYKDDFGIKQLMKFVISLKKLNQTKPNQTYDTFKWKWKQKIFNKKGEFFFGKKQNKIFLKLF